MTQVYLIGTEKSEKENSWLAMTNDKDEAARLMVELEASRIKMVKVKSKPFKQEYYNEGS